MLKPAVYDAEPTVPSKAAHTGSEFKARAPADQGSDDTDPPKKTLFKRVATMNGGRILNIGWKWKPVGEGRRK